VRLAVAETYETTDEGLTLHLFRAGGIMVQFLPVSPERAQQADFSPGDAPKGTPAPPEFQDDDAWIESRALIETVEDHELVDPTIGAERLLYRLFHERGVKVYKPLNVVELCRCTRERILNMLASFSAQERSDMGDEHGQVAITCEFCSRQYKLSCEEVENAVQTLTA
jgi:molecular chaperone Hsp33